MLDGRVERAEHGAGAISELRGEVPVAPDVASAHVSLVTARGVHRERPVDDGHGIHRVIRQRAAGTLARVGHECARVSRVDAHDASEAVLAGGRGADLERVAERRRRARSSCRGSRGPSAARKVRSTRSPCTSSPSSPARCRRPGCRSTWDLSRRDRCRRGTGSVRADPWFPRSPRSCASSTPRAVSAIAVKLLMSAGNCCAAARDPASSAFWRRALSVRSRPTSITRATRAISTTTTTENNTRIWPRSPSRSSRARDPGGRIGIGEAIASGSPTRAAAGPSRPAQPCCQRPAARSCGTRPRQ